MAEKDCTEIGLAEKSKPTAGEKIEKGQIEFDRAESERCFLSAGQEDGSRKNLKLWREKYGEIFCIANDSSYRVCFVC